MSEDTAAANAAVDPSAASIVMESIPKPDPLTISTAQVQSPRKAPASPRSKTSLPPPNMPQVKVLLNSPHHRKTIQVGNSQFDYGKNIGEMYDSTDLYRSGDREGLRKVLEREGYIFIKGAIQRDRALKARETMLKHLKGKDAFEEGSKLDDAIIRNPKESGWTVDAETGGFVFDREPDSAIAGWRKVGWSEEMRAVYAGDDLKNLYKFLFGPERTASSDGFNMLSEVTWLRAKGKGEVTAEHADYYYFKQNTSVFKDNRHPYVRADMTKTPLEALESEPATSTNNEGDDDDDDEDACSVVSECKSPMKPKGGMGMGMGMGSSTPSKRKLIIPKQNKKGKSMEPECGSNGSDGEYAETEVKDERLMTCDLCERRFRRCDVDPQLPASWNKEANGEWHCADCARQPFPLYTCWISLGEYNSGNSSLCVMPQSQVLTEFHKPLKGDLLPGDYPRLLKEKWGWQRAEISIGDIILFNVKTVHAASKNLTNSFRLSIDTRVSGKWFRPRALFGEPGSKESEEQASTFLDEEFAQRLMNRTIPPQTKGKRRAGGGMGMGMMGMGAMGMASPKKGRAAVMG